MNESNKLNGNNKSSSKYYSKSIERIKEELKYTGLSDSTSFDEPDFPGARAIKACKLDDKGTLYTKTRDVCSNNNTTNTAGIDLESDKTVDSVGGCNPGPPGWPNARKISCEGASAWEKVKTSTDVYNWHMRFTPWFSSKDISWIISQYDARLKDPREEYLIIESEFTKLLKISKS